MRGDTFWRLCRMEWSLQVRQPAFPLAVLLFSLMAVGLVATGFGPADTAITAPYVVTLSLGVLTLPGILYATIVGAAAALRDREARMHDLLDATPIHRGETILAQFAGAALTVVTVVLVSSIALAVAPHVVAIPPDRSAPGQWATYAKALAVVAIPNVLLATAMAYAIGVRTESSVASWIAGVAFMALDFASAILTDSPLIAGAAPASPQVLERAAFFDPLGLSAFFAHTRLWDVAMRNERPIGVGGHLLLNRVLIAVLCAGLLAFASRSRRGAAADSHAARSSHGRRLTLVQGGSLALLIIWTFVVLVTLHGDVGQAEYHTSLLPATGLLVESLRLPITLFGTLLVAIVAAETAWRERLSGLADVIDATGVRTSQLVLRQVRLLAIAVTVLIGATVALGVAYQLARGYARLEPAVWGSLVAVSGLPLLQLAVAAVFLQALSPNRWVGLLLTLALGFLQLRGGVVRAIAHPLARYGAAPELHWSDLRGYGVELRSWEWFMACWTAAAAVLCWLSVAVWPRGRLALSQRVARARAARTWRSDVLAIGAIASCSALMGVLWWNTARDWESPESRIRWRVAYEKAWRRTARDPVPAVTSVAAALDFDTDGLTYGLRGALGLRNDGPVPLDTIRVVLRRDQHVDELALEGATLVGTDARFGVRTFRMARPLAPGDSSVLRFSVQHSESGLSADEAPHFVARNGSIVLSPSLLPSIGYRESYELSSPSRRAVEGLPAPTPAPVLDETGRTRPETRPPWFTLDLQVSTAEDQRVVTSGRVVREWTEGGRRHVHTRSDGPIPGQFAVASARYAVQRGQHRGVPIEVYYHPAHGANIAGMLDAARHALEVYEGAWGPYRFPALRLVEVPNGFPAAALALPGVICFTEDRGFLTDSRDSTRFDLVTRRVAHEVAHMWWGNHVVPPAAEGASMVVETLAKYGEQLVLRARRGDEMLTTLLAVDAERYRAGLAASHEVEPGLWRATFQDWLFYGKGGVVMRTLSDSIGEERINAALRQFADAWGGAHAPPTTSVDLLQSLLDVTPENQRDFIRRLFTQPGLP